VNTLRSIVMLAILGAVGFGVYATLNRRPIPDPPEGLPEGWDSNPAVQLGDASGPPRLDGLGASLPGASEMPGAAPRYPSTSPAFVPPPSPMAQAASEAPAFSPPAVAQQAPEFSPPPAELAPAYTAPGTSLESPPASQAPPHLVGTGDVGMMPAMPDQLGQATTAPVAPPAFNEAPPFGDAPAHGGPATTNAVPAAAPEAQGFPSAQVPVTSGVEFAGTAAPPTQMVQEDFKTSWNNVQQALAQDRLVDALRELSRWYENGQLGPHEQQAVKQLLDQLAGTVVYSRESLLEPAYEVQPGDTLERVAAYYSVPWQILAKINGVTDPQALQTGEHLKVVRGPFSAEVNLSKFRLTLWLGDLYAGSFPVGIGADYSNTPEGEFTVQQKLENPTYYGPDQVVDANDPTNPLGEHWISLGNHLGIHGTIDAQSVGKAESRGCIRLTERDISDVYDMLTPGSKVTIRR
jgi:lipoprotein-anchoring transpeptidase ErfK/SrfK